MGRGSRDKRYDRLRRLADGPFPALTIRYGRRFLADFPDHGLAWLRVGIELVGLARYEEAEQAFAKAIEFCPEDKRHVPFAQMGHLFREAGDYDVAVDWYRRAAEVTPDDATYLIFLGGMLAKRGRFAEAEEAHRAATQCAEGCINEAWLNLGLVLRARSRYAAAAACFHAAIRLDPEYRLARRALRDVELCLKLGGA